MQIVYVLVTDAREAEGREAAPAALVVDSRSVKTTEAGEATIESALAWRLIVLAFLIMRRLARLSSDPA
jgi:hypothetical protein